MWEYFARNMGMGRFPDRTIRSVFTADRRYFDQILYKNHKFRREYATAFQIWAAAQGVDRSTRQVLLPRRIEEAAALMSEDAVRDLFGALLRMLAEEFPARVLPENTDYRDTWPGGRCDGDDVFSGPMERIRRFWTRLALPEVWDE